MKILTLSIMKKLEDAGLGVIDKDLFWEKLGLGEVGVYISDLGGTQARGSRPSASFDLICRGKSDLDGYARLEKIANFFRAEAICSLPSVPPYTDEGFANVRVLPPSAIASIGEDGNGRVLYSMTVQVLFDR